MAQLSAKNIELFTYSLLILGFVCRFDIDVSGTMVMHLKLKISFCNPILFAICTSTFRNCVKTYGMACRGVLSSVPL
jgi:hypothetical protein